MATKRIQDLENVEEVLPDSIIPVGEATKTKSMLVSQLKNWLSSFFVTLTGNQTIAGSKTFSSSLTTKTGGSAMLKGVLPNNTVGTNPSSDINVYVAGVDSGGKDQSYINFVVKTDGTGQANIVARSNSSSDRGSNGITVARKLDGTSWISLGTTTASAPTPLYATDKSTKIANTTWVHDAGAVVIAKSLGANGYVKYSSGLIIQWGSVGLGVNNITFPTAFSNENAIVCPVAYYNAASQIAYYDLTTTGCKIYPNRSDYSVRWFAIGY